MLRSACSLIASVALVFGAFTAFGAASSPATPTLKTIAVVVAHAHRNASAAVRVPAVTKPG